MAKKPQNQDIELKAVHYLKEKNDQPLYFQLKKISDIEWEVLGIEVKDGSVVREFKVKKPNTSVYAKAYLLEAIADQCGKK